MRALIPWLCAVAVCVHAGPSPRSRGSPVWQHQPPRHHPGGFHNYATHDVDHLALESSPNAALEIPGSKRSPDQSIEPEPEIYPAALSLDDLPPHIQARVQAVQQSAQQTPHVTQLDVNQLPAHIQAKFQPNPQPVQVQVQPNPTPTQVTFQYTPQATNVQNRVQPTQVQIQYNPQPTVVQNQVQTSQVQFQYNPQSVSHPDQPNPQFQVQPNPQFQIQPNTQFQSNPQSPQAQFQSNPQSPQAQFQSNPQSPQAQFRSNPQSYTQDSRLSPPASGNIQSFIPATPPSSTLYATKPPLAGILERLPSNATLLRPNIVDTFSCQGRDYGYYADKDNDCQVFHVCLPLHILYPTRFQDTTYQFSFICGNQTKFDQLSFACAHDDSFSCDDPSQFYYLNKNFFRPTQERKGGWAWIQDGVPAGYQFEPQRVPNEQPVVNDPYYG